MKLNPALLSLMLVFPATLQLPVRTKALEAIATVDSDTLKSPPVLVNTSTAPHTVEVTLTAERKMMALMPGKVTEVYAYNGSIPGPTLEAHEGDKVIVHFRNNLPEASTIHWHGLQIPAKMDGSPLNIVPHGGRKDYIFTIDSGTAGTFWYHPHPDVRTGFQVEKGLYGAIIIRPKHDPLPVMPEKLLILSDNRFHPDGSVDFSVPHSPAGIVDEENGREGNVMFVNGQIMPTIRIRSGEEQHWRIVNAGAARVYRLAIPGQTFIQIGSDGNLFEHPEEVNQILLANSERADVIVRGTYGPASTRVLRSLPYDRYAPQTRPENRDDTLGTLSWKEPLDLLTLAYTDEKPTTSAPLPQTLRSIRVLDPKKAARHRVIVFSQGLINGKVMDMNRVDIRAKLGTTEVWDIENVVTMDHPFHLHGYPFQVLDRNGVPERDRRWKDSINVPKHESVRIIVNFNEHPGLWMFHCHILDHEDHGMMGILEVN